MKDYIQSIDIISDMEKLSKLIKLREDCWKMFRVTNTVLKICADYNLTLSEISNILYQTDYKHETPSHIEKIIEKVDFLCSDLRIDKRLRIFSVNEKRKKVKKMKITIIKILKEEIKKEFLYYKEQLHYQNYLKLKIIKKMMMNILDQEKKLKKRKVEVKIIVYIMILFLILLIMKCIFIILRHSLLN